MGAKILIVDDSSTVRQQVRTALVTVGFTVVEAGDGADGLLQFDHHADLALVLCDVNMPRMDGLTMLEAMSAKGLTARIPTLMLTTEAAPGLVERAKRAGAKGWIVKPFKPELLIAAVKKLTGPR